MPFLYREQASLIVYSGLYFSFAGMALSSVSPAAIGAGLAIPVILVWFTRRPFQLQPPSKLVIPERGDASAEDILLLGELLEI